MNNNFYIVLDCEYEARVKGEWSKVSFRKHFYHKNMNADSIEEVTQLVKKFIKENKSMITFEVDNLDWEYGKSSSFCRMINDYYMNDKTIKVVVWENSEYTNRYNDITEDKITTKDIKKFVDDVMFRFNKFVVSKLEDANENENNY